MVVVMMTDNPFWWRGGDRVEVERIVSGAVAYFPANVVTKPSVRKNLVWVEHESLTVGDGGSVRMKEYVKPTSLRPSPPREPTPSFKAGDEVDFFRFNEGFWVKGSVRAVIENSRYVVEFKGGNFTETEVDDGLNLRLHHEWVDGNWVPSSKPKSIIKLKIKLRRRERYEKGTIVEVRSEEEEEEEAHKGSCYYARIVRLLGDDKYIVEHLRLKRRDGDDSMIARRDLVQAKNLRPVRPLLLSHGQWINPYKEESCKTPSLNKLKSCDRAEKKKKVFNSGMMVEVRSDQPGYECSWYDAKIISYLGKDRYMVEYQTLRTEDYRELLKEEAKGSDIRPKPPQLVQRAGRYELNEDVDAWFNDGWWSGRVYKIIDNYTRYGVHFKTTDEKLEFAYSELRPCQVWKEGKWSRVKKEKKKKMTNSLHRL